MGEEGSLRARPLFARYGELRSMPAGKESIPFEPWRDNWLATPFIEALLAGGIAGFVADLTFFPLDSLKTRLQARRPRRRQQVAPPRKTGNRVESGRASRELVCETRVARQREARVAETESSQAPAGFQAAGGFRGVYRGLGVALLGSVPCSASFFCAREAEWRWCLVVLAVLRPASAGRRQRADAAKVIENAGRRRYEAMPGFAAADAALAASGRQPSEYPEVRAVAANASSAAAAEGIISVIRTPIDALKQRKQAGTLSDAYAAAVRQNPSRLWRGWTATVLRDVPFSIIQFPLYALAKRWAHPADAPGEIEPVRAALCGMCSAATAAALTTPFDVVQTRVMVRDGGNVSATAEFAAVVRERGVAGLFRGVAPRTAWMALSGLVFLGSYEQARRWIHGGLERRRSGGDWPWRGSGGDAPRP